MSEAKASHTTFGLDILPQESTLAKATPKYALVILREGIIIKQISKVSRPRLLSLVNSYKPDILAVDNVYELAPDPNGLKHLVSSLQPETKIVQVTGPPTGALTLQEVARRHRLKPPAKLSPLEEAEASAKLAELGAGCEVQVLENETKILVCRSVALGPGGSSQSRYRRRVHGAVLNATRRIEEALRKANMDYDLFTEESDFGLERGEFTVYASRTSLYGIVKPRHGSYVRVAINPVFRERIGFVPRDVPRESVTARFNSLEKLIVGVDPGTTCGLAVLTLDFTPVYVNSRKGLTRGDITRTVMKLGEPIIVAADVAPAPNFVEKLAKTLNAVLFVPESILSTVEKQDLAQKYAQQCKVELKDSHVRDALVAAIKAFQRYKNKFEQVKVYIQEAGVRVPINEVKALVVRGCSIRKAIELLTPKPVREAKIQPPTEFEEPEPTPEEVELEVRDLQEKVRYQKDQIERLKALNDRLSRQVKDFKSKVAQLRLSVEEIKSEQTQEVRREREYQILRRENETLRKQLRGARREIQQYQKRLESLRHYKELESRGEVIFIKPIETFTHDGLKKAFQLYDVKRGDIVFLLDASGGGVSTSEELAKRGIKAVIAGTPMAHQAEETLKKYEITVVPSQKLEMKWVEGYPYAKTPDVEKAVRQSLETETLEAARTLQEMIEEYKKERAEDSKRA